MSALEKSRPYLVWELLVEAKKVLFYWLCSQGDLVRDAAKNDDLNPRGGGVHCYGLQFIVPKSPCFWTTEGLLKKKINV